MKLQIDTFTTIWFARDPLDPDAGEVASHALVRGEAEMDEVNLKPLVHVTEVVLITNRGGDKAHCPILLSSLDQDNVSRVASAAQDAAWMEYQRQLEGPAQ